MDYRVGVLEKVNEKKEQHAGLCNLVAAEGYDVMLLPFYREVLGQFLNALIVQQKRWKFPKLGKRKLHLNSTHSLQNLVSQRRSLKRQNPTAEAVLFLKIISGR
jgi:hypothetical protein